MRSVPDLRVSANLSLVTRHGLFPYARRLRDLGLSVFPIPYGSKVPLLAWKPFQDRLATDDELLEWFPDGQAMNLGIVTGAISGIVVLDADNQAASDYLWGRIPPSPWQTHTARGRHVYLSHPGGHVSNRGTDIPTPLGPLPIHVRGDSGYVLGDGSLHPSGVLYRSTVRAPRPALPVYDPSWLPVETREENSSPRQLGSRSEPNSNRLLVRARCYLAVIPPPEIGQGSDTQVFKAACRLTRGFGLSPADAKDLLWEWCGGRAGWTREWVAAKVENASYGKEPIGGRL